MYIKHIRNMGMAIGVVVVILLSGGNVYASPEVSFTLTILPNPQREAAVAQEREANSPTEQEDKTITSESNFAFQQTSTTTLINGASNKSNGEHVIISEDTRLLLTEGEGARTHSQQPIRAGP